MDISVPPSVRDLQDVGPDDGMAKSGARGVEVKVTCRSGVQLVAKGGACTNWSQNKIQVNRSRKHT